jgi:hypothetical protein
MPSASEAIHYWQQIELALERRNALPDEVERYLIDVARGLDTLIRDPKLKPAQVAAQIPQVLGLSAAAIRAHREERRAAYYGFWFELRKTPGTVESLAKDLAEDAGKTERTMYRWGKRAAAGVKEVIASITSSRRR